MVIKKLFLINLTLLVIAILILSRSILVKKFTANKIAPPSIWDQMTASDRDLFNQIYNDVKRKIAQEFGSDEEDKDIIRGENGEVIKIAGDVSKLFPQGNDENSLPLFSSTSTPFKSPQSVFVASSKPTSFKSPTSLSIPQATPLPTIAPVSPPQQVTMDNPIINEGVVGSPAPEVVATPAPTPYPIIKQPKKVQQPKVVVAKTQKTVQPQPPTENKPSQGEVKSEPKQETNPQEAPKQEHKEDKKQENKEHKKDK